MAQRSGTRTIKHGKQLQENRGKSGTRQYVRATPQFWADSMSRSSVLYPAIVSFNREENYSRPLAPMLILTRHALPNFDSFHLFIDGIPVTTRLLNTTPFIFNTDQLRLLGQFTVRICRIITNKPFVCTLDDMLYFFAPLDSTAPEETRHTAPILDQIAWDIISQFVTAYSVPINTETPDHTEQDVKDAIVQDRRTEFTRRFEVRKLRRDMTPLSRTGDESDGTLLDVIKLRSHCFTGISNEKQPIIEASVVEYYANYWGPMCTSSSKPSVKYLIPELCSRLTVPASVLRTALILPSVVHKIDSLLLVKELNATVFSNALSDRLLDIATTCPSACTELDYERLEFLGDAFLKYISSMCIVTYNAPKNERAMHEARKRMINNKTLTEKALKIGLPMYIQSRPFVPKTWKPPYFKVQPSLNMLLLGNTSKLDETDEEAALDQTHWLADKTIADVTEAIVGAAYLCGGKEAAFDVAKSLGLVMPVVDRWADLHHKVSNTFADAAHRLLGQKDVNSFLQSCVGSELRLPRTLSQTFLRQQNITYNALEFLGDAILDFFITRHVFEREASLSSGGLSLLKAAMVSNSTLATISTLFNLENGAFCPPGEMGSVIAFTKMIEFRRCEEYARAETEKRCPGQFWLGTEPPKSIVTLLKSIVGALSVSDATSFENVESFFAKVFKPFYDKHITIKTLAHRPTTTLVELLRAHGCNVFDIKKENTGEITRCQVLIHDQVLASAEDEMPSYAVMRACRSALDNLQVDSRTLFKYCNCRAQPQKKKKDDFFNQLLTLEDR